MRRQLNLIQFSRAIVPLFVMLFHANSMMIFYFHYNLLGFTIGAKSGGVYYFFALSGFMLYYLYHKEFGNSKKIKSFFYSRFIRIYPIYWILTLCVLPIYFVFPMMGHGYERDISTIITSLLLFHSKKEPLLGVAWSLVHTVYFYFIFSLVFLNNKKISKLLICTWAAISFAFCTNLLSSSNSLVSFLFNFNNLIFLSGVTCAYVVSKMKINYYLSLLCIFIGILGFPLSWFNTQYKFIDMSLQFTTGLSSVLLILGISAIDLQKDIKMPRIAKYLGDASLSIYLTHYTSMSVISKILRSILFLSFNKLLISLILLILPMIIGCIVYSLIEKPIIQKLKHFNTKNKIYSYYLLTNMHLKKHFSRSKPSV